MGGLRGVLRGIPRKLRDPKTNATLKHLTAWESDVWALKAGGWFLLLLVQVFAPGASLSWLNGKWQQNDRVVTSQKAHSYGVSDPHH